MFASERREFKRIPITSDDDSYYETETEMKENCNKGTHPLDNSSKCSYLFDLLFYFWIFKVIKTGKPYEQPTELKVDEAYKRWKRIDHKRKLNHLSTSTLSLIWNVHKTEIITIIVLQLVIVSSLPLCVFYLFYRHLSPLFLSINKSNYSDLVPQIALYAFIIFCLMCVKSLLSSYCWLKSIYIRVHVAAALTNALYYKALSLRSDEYEKQSIINIGGVDVQSMSTELSLALSFSFQILIALFTSIIGLVYVVGVLSALSAVIFLFLIGIPFQFVFASKYNDAMKSKMKLSDKRVQMITELLVGIRVVKVGCSELPLMQKVDEIRKEESVYTTNIYYSYSMLILSNFLIPSIMVLIVIIVYHYYFKNPIDSTITLSILMLSSLAAIGVRGIPVVAASIIGVVVGSQRIDALFNLKSIKTNNMNNVIDLRGDDGDPLLIQMKDATFMWRKQPKVKENQGITFCLKDISLEIKCGSLIAVIGSVGSGKTSLIQSILGEMECVSGNKNIKINESQMNEIIYCAQTPYIRNDTFKANIVLDLKYDPNLYEKCVIAASLNSDLKRLPNSHLTVIGDEGVNVSGGQKMRISFARCLYRNGIIKNSNSGNLFLFDDPLSSVDVYVGKQMFLHGIYDQILNKKKKNNKNTVLMVINSHLHLLRYFDEVIIMNKGEIQTHCTLKDLYDDVHTELYQTYKHLLPERHQMECDNEKEEVKAQPQVMERVNLINDHRVENDILFSVQMLPLRSHVEFIQSSFNAFAYKSHWLSRTNDVKQVDIQIFYKILPLIVAYLMQCCFPAIDLWILKWNKDIENKSPSLSTSYYSVIWLIMITVIAFFTFYFIRSSGTIINKASNHVHSKSLYNVLRANTLFFDITQRGDILKRFTTDTHDIDIEVPFLWFQFCLFSSSTIGYLAVICIIVPLSLIPLFFILPIIIYVSYKSGSYFFAATRRSNHLMGPILSLFSETVSNLVSIRSFQLEHYFMQKMKEKLDEQKKFEFVQNCLYSYMILYLELLFNLMQGLVIVGSGYQIAFNLNFQSNIYIVLLSCWYFIAIQQQFTLAVMFFYRFEATFISADRLMEYHRIFDENKKYGDELVHEAEPINHNYRVDAQHLWPQNGKIEINALKLRYRPHLDVVLHLDKKIKISHGSKIGICGRTGSGKSSILVSIFRLFEPFKESSIIIDELKFNELGLFDLRSNLSIISQTPILFGNCTLRFNLDPFNKYDDEEIWNALKSVSMSLFDVINQRDGKLNCFVKENGSNFSEGQKQLLCFSKVLLKKSPILFLDEATSSIDRNTDQLIQSLISKMENKTVISIAHRIQTIIGYDYIIVLDDGKIAQYDSPQNLLKDKNGIFVKLLETDKLYHHVVNNDIIHIFKL